MHCCMILRNVCQYNEQSLEVSYKLVDYEWLLQEWKWQNCPSDLLLMECSSHLSCIWTLVDSSHDCLCNVLLFLRESSDP